MFDRLTGRQTPKPKEPEPERIDLGAIRAERQMAEQQAAERQAVEPPARMPANPLTRYMGWRTRPTLPSVDLAREHDSVLGVLLEQAAAADGAAVRAQLEWEQHQPGGGGFNAVVNADATWAQPFIERKEEPPSPDPCGIG